MRTIYLSAGHSNAIGSDNGAISIYEGKEIKEGVLAYEFTERLYNKLKAMGANVVIDKPQNVLIETLRAFGRVVTSRDIAIEYHFNAGGGTGTETFTANYPSLFETALALKISQDTAITLNTKLRAGGVKKEMASARKRLGWMRLSCEAVLHEICFIDSKKDMSAYFKQIDNLVNAHADTLFKFSKK